MQPHWGAGVGGGPALPSLGSCGMRMGMRVGRCPSPGSPTPALPLMPGIFRATSSYFYLSSRSQLRCSFLQEVLWDPQAKCDPIPTPRSPCGSPLYILHHCKLLEAEAR